MKWYSTRNNTPLLSECTALVAIHNKDNDSICLELAIWNPYEKEWNYLETKVNIEEHEDQVLYFCYPDPIPEAYDDLLARK